MPRDRIRRLATAGDLTALAPYALAFFYGWGAVLVGIVTFLPGRELPWLSGTAAGIAALVAVALVRRAPRATMGHLNILVAAGSVLIGAVVYSSDQHFGPDAVMFVWVALYSGFFLSRRALAAHCLFVAASYALLLGAMPAAGAADAGWSSLVMVAGVVAGGAVWLSTLRGVADGYVAVLVHRADTDPLTGLANRSVLLRHGQQVLQERRTRTVVGMVLLDIDGFTDLNHSYQSAVGDQLLRQVGRRLCAVAPAGSVVARLSGDEFAVLMHGLPAVDFDGHVRQIVNSLLRPFPLAGELVRMTAAVGAVVADARHSTLEHLLAEAGTALAEMRRLPVNARGKGWAVFSPAMRDRTDARKRLLADLERAIQQREFVLHYQPIFSVVTGEIEAVEALVRWQHPERGMVPPDQFIPLAEQSGLIVGIGEWVLREAAERAATWPARAGGSAPVVAVNLSPRQLADPHLPRLVAEVLADTRLPAPSLMLEITETSVMVDPELARTRLAELRALGSGLAIDDFGTGHSSLSYLRQLPATELKLAREFILDLSTSQDAMALAGAIVDLSHRLGLAVVAEGIETQEQMECLRALGADLAQGYLLERPMPWQELGDLLRRGDQLAAA